MKKALIIYNPTAGIKSKNDISLDVQEKLDKLRYSSMVFFLDSNFEKNIANHNISDIDLVIAIGGDGTVKVAAKTILENKLNARLAIIPFGSGNVVGKSLGLPINIKKAIKNLDSVEDVSIDIGVVNNKHYFIVGFGAGYISEIIASTATKLKNKYGFLGYILNSFISNLEVRRKKFKVIIDGEKLYLKGNTLLVFNACNFYGIKPRMKICPNDGELDLLVATNKSFWSFLSAGIHLILFQKPHKYFFTNRNKEFNIFFYKKPNCQIDGDYIKLPKEINIKVIPKAIRVVNYAK